MKIKELLTELRSKNEQELEVMARDIRNELSEKQVMRYFESTDDIKLIRDLKDKLSRIETVKTEKEQQ